MKRLLLLLSIVTVPLLFFLIRDQHLIFSKKIDGSPLTRMATSFEETINFNITYPGYIITLEKDTLKGKIRIDRGSLVGGHPLFVLKTRVDFINEKKRIQSYSPHDLLAFSVNGVDFESLYYKDATHKGKYFFLRIIDGKLKLFALYKSKYDTYSRKTFYEPSLYLQKEKDQKLAIIEKQNYTSLKKLLKDYVDDCPSTLEKIVEKDRLFEHIEDIVNAYNSCNANLPDDFIVLENH
jgi:hypothetical protein